MNVFNRLVLIVVALLMLAIPVFLLLMGFQVIPADQVASYFDYRAALRSLDDVSLSGLARIRLWMGIGGIVLAVLAFLLFLRELVPRIRRARSAIIEDEPGKEVKIEVRALRALVEKAARETGVVSADASLSSNGNRCGILCRIEIPDSADFSELASRARDNVRKVLEEQKVPVDEIEVRVEGATS